MRSFGVVLQVPRELGEHMGEGLCGIFVEPLISL